MKISDYPLDEQEAFFQTIEQYRNASESHRLEMKYFLISNIEDYPDDYIYELCLREFNKIDKL